MGSSIYSHVMNFCYVLLERVQSLFHRVILNKDYLAWTFPERYRPASNSVGIPLFISVSSDGVIDRVESTNWLIATVSVQTCSSQLGSLTSVPREQLLTAKDTVARAHMLFDCWNIFAGTLFLLVTQLYNPLFSTLMSCGVVEWRTAGFVPTQQISY